MLVSTKGRYALRVMIDLAEHQSDGFIPLKVIAERQEISEKYLENIIKLLVKAKLLNGLRGKGGGYQLTKAPEQYTVESILRVTEDSMAPVACLEPGAEACPRASECRTLSMWQGLDKLITEYFTNITLADLMRRAPDGYDYVI
jgi:Rrf2 family protein